MVLVLLLLIECAYLYIFFHTENYWYSLSSSQQYDEQY